MARSPFLSIVSLVTLYAVLGCFLSTEALAKTKDALPAKVTPNKRQFMSNVDKAWKDLAEGDCKTDPAGSACVSKSIILVSSTCANSALFFQRGSKAWEITGFLFVIASAAFTGVGASATLAQAKVFSTLGGTTGLGAVTASIKANGSSDETAMASVNATEAAFQVFLRTGGDGGKPPAAAEIYPYVTTFAYQCVAAATGSSENGKGSSAGPPPATTAATAITQATQ